MIRLRLIATSLVTASLLSGCYVPGLTSWAYQGTVVEYGDPPGYQDRLVAQMGYFDTKEQCNKALVERMSALYEGHRIISSSDIRHTKPLFARKGFAAQGTTESIAFGWCDGYIVENELLIRE